MESVTLVLVRHGHVEGIDPPRFRGHWDLGLTEEGQAQARSVAARVAAEFAPAAIYTSPLRRCIQTSQLIGAACGLNATPARTLIDFDYGEFTWKTFEQVRTAMPEFFREWIDRPQLVRFPGGDALQDVVARSADALRLALEKHSGATAVFVTHDSVIRCLLLQLLDMPLSAYWRFDPGPCGITVATIAKDAIEVLRVNDLGDRR